VTTPGDLAAPTNLDLGGASLGGSWYGPWSGPFGDGFAYGFGYAPFGPGSAGWGDPAFYAWDNDGAYGFSTSFWPATGFGPGWSTIGAYSWWGNAGMVAPNWGVVDPFVGLENAANEPLPNYFTGGFGGYPYGLAYGVGLGWWYNSSGWYGYNGYSWLPFYAAANAPSPSTEPTDAVQQEQNTVLSLSTLAAVGKDVLVAAKNVAAAQVNSLTGEFVVATAAGFAAFSSGSEVADGGSTTDPTDQPKPLVQSLLRQLRTSVDDSAYMLDLWGRAMQDDDPDAQRQLTELFQDGEKHGLQVKAASSILENTLELLDPKVRAWWDSTNGQISADDSWWKRDAFVIHKFFDRSWMDGTRPVVRVDGDADVADIAYAIVKASQKGETAHSFREFNFYRSQDLAKGYAQWQSANLEEAVESASMLASMYYQGIASITGTGNLVVTLDDVSKHGITWNTVLSAVPFLAHRLPGAIVDGINALEIQIAAKGAGEAAETLTIVGKSLQELKALPATEAEAILKEAEGAATAFEAEAIISGRTANIGVKSATEYEEGVRALYSRYEATDTNASAVIDGKDASAVADHAVIANGKKIAIEAKLELSTGWAGSIRNPNGRSGSLFFSVDEQARILKQARVYSEKFNLVIYHSNSQQFIDTYSQLFRSYNLKNIRFVLTK